MGSSSSGKRKKIDIVEVMRLAANGNKIKEIANILGCSHDTLERRFKNAIEIGRDKQKAAIRAVLMDEALNKRNSKILEHVSNRYLGPVENKLELLGNSERPVVIENKTDLSKLSVEELEQLECILGKASKNE